MLEWGIWGKIKTILNDVFKKIYFMLRRENTSVENEDCCDRVCYLHEVGTNSYTFARCTIQVQFKAEINNSKQVST